MSNTAPTAMKLEIVKIQIQNRHSQIILDVIEFGHDLTEGQTEKANAFGATHYFKTSDIRELPKYQENALKSAGWQFVKIGHTSYKSTTWCAKKASHLPLMPGKPTNK